MTTDPRTRDELREDIRGEMLDVLGHEGAERGFGRDGNLTAYGAELDEMADALGLDDER